MHLHDCPIHEPIAAPMFPLRHHCMMQKIMMQTELIQVLRKILDFSYQELFITLAKIQQPHQKTLYRKKIILHLTLIYHHGATGLYSSRGLHLHRKQSFNPNNICISDRSKLRAERTKNSLARNSRVLKRFSYIAYIQRVMTTDEKINKNHKRKKAPFRCKRTTFAL